MNYTAVPILRINVLDNDKSRNLNRDQRGPFGPRADFRAFAQKNLVSNFYRNRRAGNDQQEAAYLTTAGLIHILRLLEVKKGVGKYSPSVGIRSALVVHGDRLIAELVIDWAFFVSKSKHQLTPR